MSIEEKAAGYHKQGYNCAQSVFAALGEYTGLDEKQALAVASGFGGGLASGEVCGAIAGAVMALGTVFPFDDAAFPERKKRVSAMAKQCVAACRECCGAVTCRDLLAKEGKAGCDRFIRECVKVAEEMILNNK